MLQGLSGGEGIDHVILPGKSTPPLAASVLKTGDGREFEASSVSFLPPTPPPVVSPRPLPTARGYPVPSVANALMRRLRSRGRCCGARWDAVDMRYMLGN